MVLVEDGPITDELESVVKKWVEIIPVMEVVRLGKNQGLAIALNEGAKYCKCDYIARMDTDDISLPNRFKLQEEYLEQHPEIVLLGGGMIEFNDEEGDFPPRVMPVSQKDIKESICKSSPFVHPSVCLKRSLFNEGFAYNPSFKKAQDLELWFRIVAAGLPVANLRDSIIKFRKDPLLYKKRQNFAVNEFKLVVKGIYSIYGLCTWRYIYPVVHFTFRLLPPKLSKMIYKKIILKYWERKSY